MAATTEALASTSISETQAAERLGVPAITLRSWRLKNKLKSDLFTVTPSPLPEGRPKVRYDEQWIETYAGSVDHPEDVESIFV
jgi:hypothetical protein